MCSTARVWRSAPSGRQWYDLSRSRPLNIFLSPGYLNHFAVFPTVILPPGNGTEAVTGNGKVKFESPAGPGEALVQFQDNVVWG